MKVSVKYFRENIDKLAGRILSETKAVFFDVDGTLWRRGNPVPDSTIEAIRKLRANGHKAFICTGRSKGHVTDERLLSIGWDGMICGCGTYVKYGDEMLEEVIISDEEWRRIDRLCKEEHVRVIIEGNDYMFFDHEDYDGDWYGEILERELGDDRKTIKDNWGNFNAGKFSVDVDFPKESKRWFDIIGKDYNLIAHSEIIYEVVPKGYDKASGVKRICERAGINLADAVAFGDGLNDLKVMKTVGTGIAMGDAFDETKAAASFVTGKVEEDGIAAALKSIGLI